ncbi:hypothetical protein E3N88_19909 [Mikania micrantha]|uniref:Actin-related protein 3 n=1 Tax=Mikania micrantha TaxID=192012 RepID=A0A5N6NRG0_9ASTR|nr:hypothetical protein E3N88_19909 [Mikania micrantha]
MDPSTFPPAVVPGNPVLLTCLDHLMAETKQCMLVVQMLITLLGKKLLALSKSRTSSTYNLSYPIKHGQVKNWDAMESQLTPPESREYTGEMMFETFNVPGLYIAVQPVLTLAAGYTTNKCEMTGVVVDVGAGATHVVPVAEGYVIHSSVKSIPISGKDATLFERGKHIPPEESLEVARKIKETYCYTSVDIV